MQAEEPAEGGDPELFLFLGEVLFHAALFFGGERTDPVGPAFLIAVEDLCRFLIDGVGGAGAFQWIRFSFCRGDARLESRGVVHERRHFFNDGENIKCGIREEGVAVFLIQLFRGRRILADVGGEDEVVRQKVAKSLHVFGCCPPFMLLTVLKGERVDLLSFAHAQGGDGFDVEIGHGAFFDEHQDGVVMHFSSELTHEKDSFCINGDWWLVTGD